jgi:hypothetical protein
MRIFMLVEKLDKDGKLLLRRRGHRPRACLRSFPSYRRYPQTTPVSMRFTGAAIISHSSKFQ